jgi:Flp pilus assembly protein TadG
MKIKFIRNLIDKRNGQSLVEFALVLPIFLLIVLGIVEFGRLWETVNVLTSAAREGVRVAAVTGPDGSQVQSAAQNLLSAANITGATISISGPSGANEVSVTVQMTYVPITGSFIPGIGSLSLSRTSTMRWEG